MAFGRKRKTPAETTTEPVTKTPRARKPKPTADDDTQAVAEALGGQVVTPEKTTPDEIDDTPDAPAVTPETTPEPSQFGALDHDDEW
jgi:hypothetical protein